MNKKKEEKAQRLQGRAMGGPIVAAMECDTGAYRSDNGALANGRRLFKTRLYGAMQQLCCRAFAQECLAIVLPSDPMSKWLCVLLLALTQLAQAAPAPEASAPEHPIGPEKTLLLKLDNVRHGVVDRTSDLVIAAMGFLGVPYRRGGTSAETGFDCSGLVRTIYGQTIGLILPRRADEQAAATQSIDKKELRPGDLVFFNTMRRAFSHVGIYVGDGKFIHAPRSGAQVRVEDMQAKYWQRRFDGARRVSADITEVAQRN